MSNKAVAGLVEAIKQREEAERKLTPLSGPREESVFAQVMGTRPAEPNKPTAKEEETREDVSRLGSSPKDEPEILQVSKKESKNVRFLTFLHKYLTDKSNQVMSYRVPGGMMQDLDDLHAELWQRFRAKTSRGALVATAVAYLIWDYKQNGKESVLYKHLLEEA
jgi:hypothetical protein